MWEFIKDNPGLCFIALYGLAEFIIALTPTKKDDAVFDIIRRIVQRYVPRLKKGGGKFN